MISLGCIDGEGEGALQDFLGMRECREQTRMRNRLIGRPKVYAFRRRATAILAALIGCAAGMYAGSGPGEYGWYRVAPESLVPTASVRLHAWHDLIAEPGSEPQMLAAERDAMAAERLSRWARSFDLRNPPDDMPVLYWAAREAAAAADSGNRSRSRSREPGDRGLLDGWISEHAARQERRDLRSDAADDMFSGFGDRPPARSWGWLADDVLERERAAAHRAQRMREQVRRDAMGVGYGGSGLPGELPAWDPSGAERTRSGRPAWR